MKKIELGQAIQILANLGVIAGIVFLGLELAQNNELMEYDRRLSALQLQLTQGDMMLSNPDLRSAAGRVLLGSEPSQAEQDQLLMTLALAKIVRTYEWQFLELPGQRDRLRMLLQDSFLWNEQSIANWEGLKRTIDPEFAAFFEDAAGLN